MRDAELVAQRGKEYEMLMVGKSGEFRLLPYTMFFSRQDFQSPVVSTDAGGFRLTHGPAGPVSVAGNLPDGPVNVLLGGSPAFGFGATSDEGTLPSQLAAAPGAAPWLNMACNGFNSTQEAVLFLLHRHQLPAIGELVVMSGLNTLVLSGLPDADRDYGQYFFSGEFVREMGFEPPKSLLSRLREKVRRRVAPTEADEREAAARVLAPEERIELALRTTARNLDRLAELAAPTGARLHYVLQPVATWTRKPYTAQERYLIDEHGPAWHGLFSLVVDPAVHQAYAPGVEALCKERDISFLDLNPALGAEPVADQWLFTDLVHLTDDGYRASARILRAELGLDAG